ncbi:MAG: beta-N-acetylhexosaminidase [Marinilabiliales bacterium]|nr:beta-N-acetylhexosaminidase [Marinilabiliales bacterium]
MKRITLRFLPLLTAFFLSLMPALQAKQTGSDLSKSNLIPRPVTIESTGEFFEITHATRILLSETTPEMQHLATYLAGQLAPATGFTLTTDPSGNSSSGDCILLQTGKADQKLGREGYVMEITHGSLRISANGPEGIFRGIQTLRQLLPARIEKNEVSKGPWKIATGLITDFPEYEYRGAMLDVARHFFGVQDVKRVIDLIAAYKMNVLHLHLSDDQGWRIEIKSWPNLTTIGGTTQVGGAKGGFYTQEEYKDIVRYAADRYVTIVPEIDMPGHTNAALASVPELNPDNQAVKLYTGTNVGFSTLQTKKEITYQFLGDVIREISGMTPGPYFHVGGDESHSTKKEDYIPFIEKVQDIVIANGKTMIGWDETALTALKPGSIAQYWAKAENAKLGVSKGARLIMSPAAKAYLDMKYNAKTHLGLKWAGLIEVDAGYKWDPATLVPGIGRENILGVECPLWSETVVTIHDIEFLVFPRLPGYAEIGWTAPALRNWDEYKVRLGHQGERFKAMGINYYPSVKVPWK